MRPRYRRTDIFAADVGWRLAFFLGALLAIGIMLVRRTLFRRYPGRSALGFTLLATQAFVYNAVIFTFSTVLTSLFDVSSSTAGLYLIPFGLANFLGALALGRLFDTVGRRTMIAGTYLASAAILAGLAALLSGGALGLWGYLAILCAAFFFASAAPPLSHGQRDVPAGDPRAGDRALLRDLDRHRRRGRPAAVRQAAGRR